MPLTIAAEAVRVYTASARLAPRCTRVWDYRLSARVATGGAIAGPGDATGARGRVQVEARGRGAMVRMPVPLAARKVTRNTVAAASATIASTIAIR
jgi:hypothetical protein